MDHQKGRNVSEKHLLLFIDSAKAFDHMDHNKLWKILREMGIPDHLTCLLRNLCAGQEATELDMKQQTGSKSGKDDIKAGYYHSAYLTYMQSLVQFSSVAQSCLTLCDPMNCSTGLPVHHQLPESNQTHVH